MSRRRGNHSAARWPATPPQCGRAWNRCSEPAGTAAFPRNGSTGCGVLTSSWTYPSRASGSADATRCARCRRRSPRPAPAITLREVTGARHVWVAEADIEYGGDRALAVIIIELDDHGLIARETRYYTEQFEAPAWRAAVAEAMD